MSAVKTDAIAPDDYKSLPLELFTITDLTDAIGVAEAAELLDTTPRAIYTVRNTNVLSFERRMKLIDAVKANETELREKLANKRRWRAERHAKATGAQ
jgi:hypothetical protein